MRKVLDKWWFTTYYGECIGIIKTYNETTKETVFRIGVGDGFDEIRDIEKIMGSGDKFYPELIK